MGYSGYYGHPGYYGYGYGLSHGWGGYYGLGHYGYYGLGGCRNNLGALVPCAAPAIEEPADEVSIADLGARTETITDAEADPYLLYSGYGYGLGYGWGGYYGLGHYGYGCRNVHGALVPCAH